MGDSVRSHEKGMTLVSHSIWTQNFYLSSWLIHQNTWSYQQDVAEIFEMPLSPWNCKVLSKILSKHKNNSLQMDKDRNLKLREMISYGTKNIARHYFPRCQWRYGYKIHLLWTNFLVFIYHFFMIVCWQKELGVIRKKLFTWMEWPWVCLNV